MATKKIVNINDIKEISCYGMEMDKEACEELRFR